MSKSLGNYIGITEPPPEMFGKVMSVSDDLMWRYYELLTDLRAEEIAALRAQAESGARHPRDLKVELAKHVITDFHSRAEADAAEEEFNRVFKRRETPDEIEERALAAGTWKLPRLLVETNLAPSMAEARRLVEQGGVKVDGQKIAQANSDVELKEDQALLLQVGKRHFLKVRGGFDLAKSRRELENA
jgi:tyrosyl-tRNA synthetase